MLSTWCKRSFLFSTAPNRAIEASDSIKQKWHYQTWLYRRGSVKREIKGSEIYWEILQYRCKRDNAGLNLDSESETRKEKARGRENKSSSRFPDQIDEGTTQDKEQRGPLEWSPDSEVYSAKLCMQDLMENHTDKSLGYKEGMSRKMPTEGTVVCHDKRSCRNGWLAWGKV